VIRVDALDANGEAVAVNQGCKSIVTSLSAVAIALLSPLNIAHTTTDTIVSVLSPLLIAIVFALLKNQLSSCFVICLFMNTTQPAFL
jgi:hypothetical protein